MCGIAGYIGKGNQQLLGKMLGTLRHRGPDGEGTWYDDRVGLGHRRLSIIDLAGGHQPMTNEDETVWIVFNGEIYNYQELRRDLEARGHVFATNSDTEAIVHGYEEWGTECVERLQGMFAFALWDCRREHLFCARDRLGIKPFYFCQVDGAFLFASELKSILAHPAAARRVNKDALHKYLTFRYVPGPETIYENLWKLDPGHRMTVTRRSSPDDALVGRVERYWSLSGQQRFEGQEDEALNELEELLTDAVRKRLIADVPVGAYLSGGLDSSVITALMAQASKTPVETFAVAFARNGHDERRFSDLVAAKLGTAHHVLETSPAGARLVPKVLWHLDQPLADAACIPLYQMAESTKPHVTVVLSGEGADECFAGYSYMKAFATCMRLGWLLGNAATRALAKSAQSSTARRALAMAGWSGDVPGFLLRTMAYFDAEEKRMIYGPAMLEQFGELDEALADLVERHTRGPREPFAQLSKFLFEAWLPDDLLAKNDAMTMAHGIEARVPYLDHRLVEWSFALPTAMKIRGLTDKYILRRLARNLVPAEICRRKKHGFTVPLEEWRGTALSEASRAARRAMSEAGLIDLEAWQAVADGQPRNAHHRRQQRAMWTLEQWWQHVHVGAEQ